MIRYCLSLTSLRNILTIEEIKYFPVVLVDTKRGFKNRWYCTKGVDLRLIINYLEIACLTTEIPYEKSYKAEK